MKQPSLDETNLITNVENENIDELLTLAEINSNQNLKSRQLITESDVHNENNHHNNNNNGQNNNLLENSFNLINSNTFNNQHPHHQQNSSENITSTPKTTETTNSTIKTNPTNTNFQITQQNIKYIHSLANQFNEQLISKLISQMESESEKFNNDDNEIKTRINTIFERLLYFTSHNLFKSNIFSATKNNNTMIIDNNNHQQQINQNHISLFPSSSNLHTHTHSSSTSSSSVSTINATHFCYNPLSSFQLQKQKMVRFTVKAEEFRPAFREKKNCQIN